MAEAVMSTQEAAAWADVLAKLTALRDTYGLNIGDYAEAQVRIGEGIAFRLVWTGDEYALGEVYQ